MPRLLCLLAALLALSAAGLRHVRAIDQAMPGNLPANHPPIDHPPATVLPDESARTLEWLRQQNRTQFEAQIDLASLRVLAIQHEDQLKILDSWARQSLSWIRNTSSIDGHDPLYTALDMTFRPEIWADQNILYVQAVPLRQDLARLVADPEEQKRILTKATISPNFFDRRDVRERLDDISRNTTLAPSVNKVYFAYETFTDLAASLHILPPAPPTTNAPWLHPAALLANDAAAATRLAAAGQPATPVPGFSPERSREIVEAYALLGNGWRSNDVAQANQAIARLTALLPSINPAEYPSPFKRNLELWYSRTFNGTLIALIYAAACTLFVVTSASGVKKMRRPAMIFFTLALACHVTAMLVRWYLAGRIPNQNQFESVFGAALLGCLIGWGLELWRKNNLFGMALSAVGFLAMTACFVFPFVIGTEMGASIGRVAGILSNTYWLYIHVNVVIWSYSLIAAGFVLGATYLLVRLWHWINPLEPDFPSDLTQPDSELPPSETPRSGVPPLGGEFLERSSGVPPLGGNSPAAAALATAQPIALAAARRATLQQLDAANMVVLQMAFWMLGAGIACGAVWADVSWGRPWGWDPKETFALVTWIVYLIVVHLRIVTPRNKADVTAWLSIAGFAIMLFNWIGVNFFLAGLHSYA